MDIPIRRMETVIATVSGYHGLERFNLIKLISQSGASYVGAMSRSTTHLVCWNFEGRKYDLAKKFKTIIVNHRWVEDCIKQGKRVPEHPYMLHSGKELGPLLLEVPTIDKVGFLNKNRKALSDKSNTFDDSERLINGRSCGDSGLAVCTDSLLFNENLFPRTEIRKNKINASKSKQKQAQKSSKQEHRSSGRHCFQDPPLSGLVSSEDEDSSSKSSKHSLRGKGKISWNEELSICSDNQLVRGKRKISDDIGSTFRAKPSGNGRRLVKKNVSRDNLEIEILDSENINAAAPSKYEDRKRNANMLETGRTSDDALHNGGASTYAAFDDIEEIRYWNLSPASKDLNLYPKEALATTDCCPANENFGGKNKVATQSEPTNPLPTSVELSCVICWTEFSSTRGVLPCGHRFCYSCIQNWADHMISSRKNSTCPLCKASFVRITKVEDAVTSDQKIYSQTIPRASSATDIFLLNDQDRYRFGAESLSATVCGECCRRDPEDLLVSCHYCQIQCIHIYCLDPPLLPWTCIHCKDLQRLYHHAR